MVDQEAGLEIPAALVDPVEVLVTLGVQEAQTDPVDPADQADLRGPEDQGRSVEHQAKNLLFGMSSS